MTKKPEKPESEGRDAQGRFRKGYSGNPGGSKRTTLYDAVAEWTKENSGMVTEKLTELVGSGDTQIIAQLLRHSLPKGRLTKFDLGDDPAASILTAVSSGKLSAEEGQAMARIVELVDHEKRLKAIEEKLGGKQ